MADPTDALVINLIASTKEFEKQMGLITARGEAAAKKIENAFTKIKLQPAGGGNAMQAATRGIEDTTRASQQLGFQINDISTQLASGTSPFTVLAQQGSQIAQSFAGAGGAMGVFMITLRALVNPITLISIAFAVLTTVGSKFFSSSEEKAEKAAKKMKELGESIQALADKYKDFLSSGTTEVLIEIEAQADFADAEKRIKDFIDEMRKQAGAAISNMDLKLPEFDFSKLGFDVGRVASEKFLTDWQALITSVENGNPDLEKARGILSEFDKYALQAPNGGFKELADFLRHEVIPNLQSATDKEKALAELRKVSVSVTREQVKAQQEYNKATEKLKDIARGPMSDVEKIMEQHKLALDAAAKSGKDYAAQLAEINHLTELALAQVQSEQITDLSQLSNLSDYAKIAAQLESGGNPNAKNASGASGLFQFMPQTWANEIVPYLKSLPQYAAMTREQLIAQRNNVELQTVAFEKFTHDNEAYLIKHGKTVSDATRYMAHVLGRGGAVALLNANPNAPVSSVTGAAAARQNPTLLGNRTVAEAIQAFQSKVAGAAAAVGVEEDKRKLDLKEKEAQIDEKIGKGYDAKAAAAAEEKAYLEEIDRLTEKHHGDVSAITKEEKDQARIIAQRAGQLAGQEEGTKKAESVEEAAQSLKDQNELLTQQTDALGALTAAYDANAAAQAAKIDVTKIENDLAKQGITLTEEQKKSLYDLALANEVLKQKSETAKQAQTDFKTKQDENRKATEEFVQQVSGIAKSAISGFINDLRNGVSAGEAFANMLDRIIDGIINMAIEALFSSKALGGLFGNLLGGGGGGGYLAHTGGTVGTSLTRDPRRFSPALWAHAPRMHSGGMVGLRAGEVPIIAQRGEIVVPRSMVGRGGSGGKVDQSVHQDNKIRIDMGGSGFVAANNKDAKQVGENIQALIQSELVRQSRPGGLLRRVPA